MNYVVLDKPVDKSGEVGRDGRVNGILQKPTRSMWEEEKTVEVEGESSFRLKLKNFKIVDAAITFMWTIPRICNL